MAYRSKRRRRVSKRSFMNHRHRVRPMSGLTSIPKWFRGRRG